MSIISQLKINKTGENQPIKFQVAFLILKWGNFFSKICRLRIILKLWNMKIHHKVKR